MIFIKEKKVFEDGNIFENNSDINLITDVETSMNNTTQQNDDETLQTSEMTTTPLKDEVITPENQTKENVKSTGVSTYISVPDITTEKQICNLKMLTVWDKINMWTVFLSIAILLIFFGKEGFEKLAQKITKVLKKFQFIINILFFALTITVFLYPKFFNSGISGNINIFTMIEFALFIFLNSATTIFIIEKFLKKKNFIFKDKKVSFSGISFLKKSLWTFTFTSLLFFFFTEAQIAYIL